MKVSICEVGPRDGLQNEKDVLPPATRAELVNRLAAAGLPRVEAASFVSAERVPQMADAEEVVKGIERLNEVLAKMESNQKLEDLLSQVMSNTDQVQALAKKMGVDAAQEPKGE